MIHCEPDTTDGEKALPILAATSLGLISEVVPSLPFAVGGNTILLSGEVGGWTLLSTPIIFLFATSAAEVTQMRAPLAGIGDGGWLGWG